MGIDKYQEPFKISEMKPLTDKQRIEICKQAKQKLIIAERITNNKWSYDKVDSNAVEDAICMLGDYIEMLEALIAVKKRQRAKQIGEAIEKMKEGKENEKNNC